MVEKAEHQSSTEDQLVVNDPRTVQIRKQVRAYMNQQLWFSAPLT